MARRARRQQFTVAPRSGQHRWRLRFHGVADHRSRLLRPLAGAAALRRIVSQPSPFARRAPLTMRGRQIWLVAAVVAAALLVAGAWLANVNQPGTPFVEYRMEHPLDMPTAIAAAPDGSIWFTIDLAAAMGRVRDGHLERFPLPSNNVEPSGLGVGPDGRGCLVRRGRGLQYHPVERRRDHTACDRVSTWRY